MEAIKEVMGLVEAHRKEVIKVLDGEGSLIDVQSAEQAIESKLRELLEQKSARVAELEKDAARYRWLRDICGIVEYKAAFGSIGPGMLPSGENLDAAIDTAMQKD